MNIKNEIEVYKKAKGSKKGFLFGKENLYFFDNKTVQLSYVNISVSCKDIFIEYETDSKNTKPSEEFFIWFEGDKVHIAAKNSREVYKIGDKENLKIFILYHINYDDEADSVLRGVIFADTSLENKLFTLMFTEKEIEELIMLLMNKRFKNFRILNETAEQEEMAEYAEEINKRNVNAVMKMYIIGEKI